MTLNQIYVKNTLKTLFNNVLNLCKTTLKSLFYCIPSQVKDDIGDVDILINNAGIVTGRNFLECDDEKIIKTMDVNTMAHFWVSYRKGKWNVCSLGYIVTKYHLV